MYQLTKQQHANLIEARDVMWPSVPPENVTPRLGSWGYAKTFDQTVEETVIHTCDTVACFGGWCLGWPNFAKQTDAVLKVAVGNTIGMYADASHNPADDYSLGAVANSVAEKLFGDERLFVSVGDHVADYSPSGRRYSSTITDHEIVTRRLNYILDNCTVS